MSKVSYEDAKIVGTYPPRSTTEKTDMGVEMMNGVKVVGTRETITIAAGASGHDQPVVTGKEAFYAPELKIDMALKEADPRRGMWAREIQNLVRGEPDAKQFGIPPDYEMFDNRPMEKR
jgi:hypothetical protein